MIDERGGERKTEQEIEVVGASRTGRSRMRERGIWLFALIDYPHLQFVIAPFTLKWSSKIVCLISVTFHIVNREKRWNLFVSEFVRISKIRLILIEQYKCTLHCKYGSLHNSFINYVMVVSLFWIISDCVVRTSIRPRSPRPLEVEQKRSIKRCSQLWILLFWRKSLVDLAIWRMATLVGALQLVYPCVKKGISILFLSKLS